MNEFDKMKAGMWYDANYNPELVNIRYANFDKCHEFNQLKPTDPRRYEVLKSIFGYLPEGLEIVGQFNCDYGTNIHLGKNVFVNFNNYFMDCADITIGDHCFIGPFCGFYTATHPIQYNQRNKGLEKALPIKIGDNCWFGANVSVMPGVTIGNGCVIAAGAVVTKDMPDNVVIAGVPAKIVKEINQNEE